MIEGAWWSMTYNDWLNGIAAAYNVDLNSISTSETSTEYLAFFKPINYASTEINIVSLKINKSDITP